MCQACLCAKICARSIISSSSSTPLSGVQSWCHPLFLPCIMRRSTTYIYLLLCLSRSKWMANGLRQDRNCSRSGSQLRSRGREVCLNRRVASDQGRFCSCLSADPQVVKWARPESERGKWKQRVLWNSLVFSLSQHSSLFYTHAANPPSLHTCIVTAYIYTIFRQTGKRLRPPAAKCSHKAARKSSTNCSRLKGNAIFFSTGWFSCLSTYHARTNYTRRYGAFIVDSDDDNNNETDILFSFWRKETALCSTTTTVRCYGEWGKCFHLQEMQIINYICLWRLQYVTHIAVLLKSYKIC